MSSHTLEPDQSFHLLVSYSFKKWHYLYTTHMTNIIIMITCCYVQSCHGLWVQEVQSWSSGEHQVVFVAFIKHQEHQVTTLKTTSHKTHNEPLKVVIKRLSNYLNSGWGIRHNAPVTTAFWIRWKPFPYLTLHCILWLCRSELSCSEEYWELLRIQKIISKVRV